jgi:hypothetical protein
MTTLVISGLYRDGGPRTRDMAGELERKGLANIVPLGARRLTRQEPFLASAPCAAMRRLTS